MHRAAHTLLGNGQVRGGLATVSANRIEVSREMSEQGGNSLPSQSSSQLNLAPWGTKARMRTLAIVSVACALVLIAIGAYLVSVHHRGGAACLIVGGADLVLMAVMWPLARRRGKA